MPIKIAKRAFGGMLINENLFYLEFHHALASNEPVSLIPFSLL
jgi:hypothetical protein